MAHAHLSPVSTEAASVRLANRDGALIGVGGGSATPLDERFRTAALDAPDAIEDYPASMSQSGHPVSPTHHDPAAPDPSPSAKHALVAPVVPDRKITSSRRRSVTVGGQEIPVEEVSSRTGLQTNIVTWRVVVDDLPHEIVVKHGQISGRRRVFIDSVLVHDSRKLFDTGSSHEFIITSPGTEPKQRKFTVAIVIRNYTHYEYKLMVDGIDLEHADGVSVKDSHLKLTHADPLQESKSDPDTTEHPTDPPTESAATAPADQPAVTAQPAPAEPAPVEQPAVTADPAPAEPASVEQPVPAETVSEPAVDAAAAQPDATPAAS